MNKIISFLKKDRNLLKVNKLFFLSSTFISLFLIYKYNFSTYIFLALNIGILSLMNYTYIQFNLIRNKSKTRNKSRNKSNRIFTEEERTYNSYEEYLKFEKEEILTEPSDLERKLESFGMRKENFNKKNLKKRYIYLAKKYHPDKISSNEIRNSYTESMSIINSLYKDLKTYL